MYFAFFGESVLQNYRPECQGLYQSLVFHTASSLFHNKNIYLSQEYVKQTDIFPELKTLENVLNVATLLI